MWSSTTVTSTGSSHTAPQLRSPLHPTPPATTTPRQASPTKTLARSGSLCASEWCFPPPAHLRMGVLGAWCHGHPSSRHLRPLALRSLCTGGGIPPLKLHVPLALGPHPGTRGVRKKTIASRLQWVPPASDDLLGGPHEIALLPSRRPYPASFVPFISSIVFLPFPLALLLFHTRIIITNKI